MGARKVADVPTDADAPEYQTTQQTQNTTGLDSICVGEEDGKSTEQVQTDKEREE